MALVWWCLSDVAVLVRPPVAMQWPLQVLNMYQSWRLFAPRPNMWNYYIVMPATLADGSSVDLLPALLAPPGFGYFDSTQPVNWTQPDNLGSKYSIRWVEYFSNLNAGWTSDFAKRTRVEELAWFGQWVCRSWNFDHSAEGKRRLHMWSLIYFIDNRGVVEQKGERVNETTMQRITMWNQRCGDV